VAHHAATGSEAGARSSRAVYTQCLTSRGMGRVSAKMFKPALFWLREGEESCCGWSWDGLYRRRVNRSS
jgi:hypothetical protein